MTARVRWTTALISLLLLLSLVAPIAAQGGAGTKDFPIRDFGACINLPDFTVVTEPDAYNSLYTVPGLFEIKFAEYLMPLATLPGTGDEIYNAMIALLNTVSASDYARISFDHPQYVSAAVEFTLDGQRMFGMIYRNQDDKLFFLFADKVEGFDMLAIGRAIFAADSQCTPLSGSAVSADAGSTLPQAGLWTFTSNEWLSGSCNNGNQITERTVIETFTLPVVTTADGSFAFQDSTSTLPFVWNAANNYYTTDMTPYMSPGDLIDFADAQGTEIRLRVQSPTVMTGELVYWFIVGGIECSAGTTVTMTRN